MKSAFIALLLGVLVIEVQPQQVLATESTIDPKELMGAKTWVKSGGKNLLSKKRPHPGKYSSHRMNQKKQDVNKVSQSADGQPLRKGNFEVHNCGERDTHYISLLKSIGKMNP